jgi:hypothetical protein
MEGQGCGKARRNSGKRRDRKVGRDGGTGERRDREVGRKRKGYPKTKDALSFVLNSF